MIELYEDNLKDFNKQSSKGNQLKWETDNYWYKSDYAGYEGLSEYVISELLRYSTLNDKEYICYTTEAIQYKRQQYLGCKSKNFVPEGWKLMTLERLFQLNGIDSLCKQIYKIESIEERVHYLVNETIKITGLNYFGEYLTKMMAIDAFFLNEDRHMHNIAVLIDDKDKFHYCPYFDHGAALLSDITMDYPLNESIYDLIKDVKSKTISNDFIEQLDAFEKIYGNKLNFKFNEKDIRNILDRELNYPNEIKERVFNILLYQKNKYQYLFNN